MLFQIPRPRVEKGDDRDPLGRFALAALRPPSSLESVTTGEKVRPCFASKVGDEDDKGPRDDDISRFELNKWSVYVGHEDH
jgi:hypothetical protein